jgi:hypothetical protein
MFSKTLLALDATFVSPVESVSALFISYYIPERFIQFIYVDMFYFVLVVL